MGDCLNSEGWCVQVKYADQPRMPWTRTSEIFVERADAQDYLVEVLPFVREGVEIRVYEQIKGAI